MAEKYYPIPEAPVYDPNIRQLLDSDPASASAVFNPLFERLIANIHALKLLTDGKAELDKGGKVPLAQLPMTSELSATSENPVAANVIYAALDSLNAAITNINTALSSHTHSAATTKAAGFMAAADKTKLDGITAKATANAASTTVPKALGTAAAGSEAAFARGDHVHPKPSLTDLGAAASSHTHNYAGSASAGGAATSAVKLQTARTFRTNLASTATASFDGSGNVTPGVTGILPIANGGTGASTAAAVLANLGACKIVTGTYTGNDSERTYGPIGPYNGSPYNISGGLPAGTVFSGGQFINLGAQAKTLIIAEASSDHTVAVSVNSNLYCFGTSYTGSSKVYYYTYYQLVEVTNNGFYVGNTPGTNKLNQNNYKYNYIAFF